MKILDNKYVQVLTKSVCLLILLIPAFTVIGLQTVRAENCLDIKNNIGYGMTDNLSDNSILQLQNYLKGLGYLSATPNGHFGPATESAVKIFQTINSIDSIGYVGPMTRAKIKARTCLNVTTVNTHDQSNITPTPTVTTTLPGISQTPSSVQSLPTNMGIIYPITGQILSIGSSTVIKWTDQPNEAFNIVLEQPGGIGAGFVAYNIYPTASNYKYVWKVGTVYISRMNSNTTMKPGTYRLRLQSMVHGASSNDPVSGWFTVVAQQFGVSNIIPSSAYADNASPVVLFGTGLSGANIYFDTNYSSLRASNQYLSSDGSVLVFTIPSAVTSGIHTLYITNNQNQNPITMPFTVNKAQ